MRLKEDGVSRFNTMDLHALGIRAVIGPLWARWEDSAYLKHYRRLRQSQYDPMVTVRSRQWDAVRAQLRHAAATVPFYQERLAAISAALTSQSGSWAATTQAPAIIYGIVQQQSQLTAFVDNFRLFGIVSLLCVPLVFLFKRVGASRAKTDVH